MIQSTKLTALGVKRVRKRAARFELPDSRVHGLRLVVQPTGSKSWCARYTFDGRDRKLTIGPYPRVSLKQARTLASRALRTVHEGKDPAAIKIEARQRAAVDSIGAWYVEYDKQHISTLAASTAKEMRRLFDIRILPKWKNRSATGITKRDALALMDASASPVAASHLLAALRHFFNWLVRRDVIAVSPCAGIQRPAAPNHRDRTLADQELLWVWRACEEIGFPFGPITQLLILTGARRDEVRAMREGELNLPKQLWTLPGERTKNGLPHEIFLSDTAVAILKRVPRIANKSGFIFSNSRGTAASGFSRAKVRIDNLMIDRARTEEEAIGGDPAKVEIAPWVIHDLRRTFASGLARLGVRLEVIERCLNHVSGSFGGIVGVYQRHSFADEKAAAFKAWGEHVAALVR